VGLNVIAEFTCAGRPRPQGSAKAYVRGKRAVVVSKTPELTAWRGDIAAEARIAMAGRAPVEGPVAVVLRFRPKPRPASHFLPANSRRPVRVLRADAPRWCDTTPDADKCARAGLDAMTGVVWVDDRQVSRLLVETVWPGEGTGTGVDVMVRRLEDTL
jgi:Holliday junction resolvase RusA-like endonuclease